MKRTLRRLLLPTLIVLVATLVASSQTPPPASAFHAVSYVEVLNTPQARTAAIKALKNYMTASRAQNGFVQFEGFEQTGRPGHFAFIETWRDQEAFDKRGATIQKELTDALQPIRVSDLDRRPYKTLAIGPAKPATDDAVFIVTHVDSSPNPQISMMLQRLAENSRREDGNLRFDVLLHAMRSNHFTVVEAWRNRKALDAHAAASHTRQYRDEFGPMAGSPLDERVFESIEW